MTRKIITYLFIFTAASLLCTTTTNTYANDKEVLESDQNIKKLPETLSLSKKWALRQPQENTPAFKGVVSFDTVGTQSGAMMYPAPNVIGLVAAVLTHAAISETSQSSEKLRLQKEADKILDPYRNTLEKFSYTELMQSALGKLSAKIDARLLNPVEKSNDAWVAEFSPVFSLTQDQQALILDNTIAISPPSADASGKNQVVVRVVSVPRNEKFPMTTWLAEDGKNIKEESADLFAQSLLIALSTTTPCKEDDRPFKTIRYREGDAEKVERAQIIDDRCGRVLMKSLRGIFMSVPVNSDTNVPNSAYQCGDDRAALKF